jgi:hypothetical protein
MQYNSYALTKPIVGCAMCPRLFLKKDLNSEFLLINLFMLLQCVTTIEL